MFNEDYLKFETQLLVIDVMMQSIDEVLEFIRIKNIQKKELSDLVAKIFVFCKRIVEAIPPFVIPSSTSKQQLLNSIAIVQKYWDENDMHLFVLNWFLFVAQWNDFSDIIKRGLRNNTLNYFSVN